MAGRTADSPGPQAKHSLLSPREALGSHARLHAERDTHYGTRGPIVRQGQGPGTGRRRCTLKAGPTPPSPDGASAGTAVSGHRSRPTGQKGAQTARWARGAQRPCTQSTHPKPGGQDTPGEAEAAQGKGTRNREARTRQHLEGSSGAGSCKRDQKKGSARPENQTRNMFWKPNEDKSLSSCSTCHMSRGLVRSLRTNPQVWQSIGRRCPAQSGLNGRLGGPGSSRGRKKSEKQVYFTER